jgi:DNA mismatch endonuclease, patch repair protein
MPKSRIEFWSTKFAQNVSRDKKIERELRSLGWRVLTIWECETFDSHQLTERLERLFESREAA